MFTSSFRLRRFQPMSARIVCPVSGHGERRYTADDLLADAGVA